MLLGVDCELFSDRDFVVERVLGWGTTTGRILRNVGSVLIETITIGGRGRLLRGAGSSAASTSVTD